MTKVVKLNWPNQQCDETKGRDERGGSREACGETVGAAWNARHQKLKDRSHFGTTVKRNKRIKQRNRSIVKGKGWSSETPRERQKDDLA